MKQTFKLVVVLAALLLVVAACSSDDSSDSDSAEGLTFEIEGWNEPAKSVFVDNFIADMKVGY